MSQFVIRERFVRTNVTPIKKEKQSKTCLKKTVQTKVEAK